MDKLYTVNEVAEILSTTEKRVRDLNKAGLLRFMQLGQMRVRAKTLEDFMERWDGWDLLDPFHPKKMDFKERRPS